MQKWLAQQGLGSRREIEQWITAGEVLINGEPAILGSKVSATDRITVRGKAVATNTSVPQHQVILYNKPEGEICTRSDPEGRRTVFASLPHLKNQRWVAVGRLDINSSGLIIFTTDGELANTLMHPKANIEREYAVRVLGTVTPKILHNVTHDIVLDDGITAKFNQVKPVGGKGANLWYNVTLPQGRYREVRRIWESQGLQVSRLIRIRYGKYKLPKDLAPGQFIELDYQEVKAHA